jgi:hypothetical protein
MAIVPVVAPYRIALPTPITRATSRSVIRSPLSPECNSPAMRSARSRPLASSGSLPSENSAKSCFGTT